MRVKLTAFVISALIDRDGRRRCTFYFLGQVLPAVRVRPALRPDHRADGLPRRASARSAGRCSARWCWSRSSSTLTLQFSNGYVYARSSSAVLFLLVILFLPRGIVPTARREAHRAAGRPAAAAAAEGASPPSGTTAGAVQAADPVRRAPGACDDRAAAGRGRLARPSAACRRSTAATIEVEEGSIAGLIGPNGSGKTTLFNVITGYERVDSGEVYLDEQADHQRCRRTRCSPLGIGRTFQLTRIFARLTVLENMIVAAQHAERSAARERRCATRSPGGGPATRRRAMELLDFIGIAQLAGELRRRRSPTASASCSSSPTCWSPTRRSSCSTSRPAGSTRP